MGETTVLVLQGLFHATPAEPPCRVCTMKNTLLLEACSTHLQHENTRGWSETQSPGHPETC